MLRLTSAALAYGEVEQARCRDAGIKCVTKLTLRTGDGGKKSPFTGVNSYKP